MIKFYTKKPNALLQAFEAKIKKGSSEGGISGWKKSDSGDFTHVADRSKGVASFAAKVVTPEGSEAYLQFILSWGKDNAQADIDYAFKEMTGNLLATFIDHFSGDFSKAVYSDGRED